MKTKFIVVLALLLSANAFAVSVSFLHGNTFRDDLGYGKEKTTMTIEHFGLWEYGNVFFYYDITEPFSKNNQDSSQFFGGIAPTASLSKILNKNVSYGFIKDVSIRVELENGSGYGINSFRNYFYGLQYDLAVPGFDFFTFNTVIRDNPLSRGVGFQIGAFWQMTWEYGPWRRFKFTGFLAASPWDGDQDPELHPVPFSRRGRYLTTQPQLLWDVGNGWFGKPNRIEVGTEFAHFVNRYQLRGKAESALQAMVKFSY